MLAEVIKGLRLRRDSGAMEEESEWEKGWCIKKYFFKANPARVEDVLKLVEDLAQIR